MKKQNIVYPSNQLLLLLVAMVLLCSCEKDTVHAPTSPPEESAVDTMEKPCPEGNKKSIIYEGKLCHGFRISQFPVAKSASLLVTNQTNSVLWAPGQTIRVKFIDPEDKYQLHALVKEYAKQWEAYASIRFKFVSSTETAQIKVGFKEGAGHWSLLGRGAHLRTQSMNLDPKYKDNLRGIKSTILHEFGHALGLIHEHQHPEANINWNKDAVYRFYMDEQEWSKKEIEENLFEKNPVDRVFYTSYDPTSIMHYPVRQAHTTDCFSIAYNYVLSDMDKLHISKIYPPVDDIKAYTATRNYQRGDYMVYKGRIYRALQDGLRNSTPETQGSRNKWKDITRVTEEEAAFLSRKNSNDIPLITL
ncbi:hypothetical protein HN014_18310 [Aquimarina sp. TRL1]|uniref:M12 family metallopeptidase n=1 Tax=Aquimarina sp. (strain TRL1) TaxID=2736252 RepID=UPI00158A31D5|nr:M12 family metallopeptidase [Aquimarina sp. TRL1]QKX06786.1 hypothetical protein HN014_18310 [Aquimarina sp. TRL1]